MAIGEVCDRTRCYRTPRSELIVRRDWLVDAGMYVFMILWMLLAFGTIQAEGPSVVAVVGAVAIGLVGLLYLSNQKISYLQIGDKVVLETKKGDEPTPDTQKNDPQEQNR